MSRLTSNPFNKPSSFIFPREPISPPETLLTDTGNPVATVPPPTNTEHREREEEHVPFNVNHASLSSHPRVGRPSISYQNSGFRESPSRSVNRNYRFFVVVIPPSRLIHEHGQLGHTLASGPPDRLSQGIIMPLFPTMYAQLTSIAKEFNFPSTTGLCLYLQVNENGVVMTPRISDESWHMLWSHLFDTSSAPRGPPIGGRIEFDIDFQQARWYSSWLSTIARDPVERHISHLPSYSSSVVVPAENHNSIDGESLRGTDRLENSPPLPQPRNNRGQHVPRKLSLVDRFDAPASRAESRASATQGLGVPDQGISSNKALSPIAQEDEPRSAREHLDDRVNSWRASAIAKPGPLSGRGQTSLEPIYMPNNISVDGDTPSSTNPELNLEDFTWSISSAGPDDYDVFSCGSPSERLPSPDMAYRMFDDSPPTPSTVTSWGAPLSYPPSPLSDYRPPSLDLAFRSRFSPPMTPATATSWGPASPATSFSLSWSDSRTGSIHLGDRGEFSRPVTPSTATTWGAPLSYPPTPSTPFYVRTPDIAHRHFDLAPESDFMTEPSYRRVSTVRPRPWRFVWPYTESHGTKSKPTDPVRPWRFVWPYTETGRAESKPTDSVRPWRFVWPYVDYGHQDQSEDSVPTNSGPEAPSYPFFSIYQSVYPHFDLYPASAASVDQKPNGTTPIKVTLNKNYPSLEIYAPVYPHNLTIYPEVQLSEGAPTPVFVSSSQYPMFDLYPTSSALNEILPAVPPPCGSCAYPVFNIYPAVYPNFDLYPAIEPLVPTRPLGTTRTSYGVYPNLVIYSHSYPHLNIYPPKAAEVLENLAPVIMEPIKVILSTQYPYFDIYPAIYPNFNIYPGLCSSHEKEVPSTLPVVVSDSQYPALVIYPAVYPHFDIYPSEAGRCRTVPQQETSVVIQSDAYPVIRPYPPVFPHFDLYPSKTADIATADTKTTLTLAPLSTTAYPILVIYPAVYPHFSLYPPIPGQLSERVQESSSVLVSRYPFLQIYPPVYPHLSIYPDIAAYSEKVTTHGASETAKVNAARTRKSHCDLHREVFPYGPVCTPSGTSMISRAEIDLRPLNIQPRHIQRRIVATRSPTGPALLRPSAPPPALPSPKRKLPTPPLTANGAPPSLNTTGYIRTDVSPTGGYSQGTRSPSRTAVTAIQRASMISPLRHMPLPKSADSINYAGEDLPGIPQAESSGLSRARSISSVGVGGRSPSSKLYMRDSLLLPRRHDL